MSLSELHNDRDDVIHVWKLCICLSRSAFIAHDSNDTILTYSSILVCYTTIYSYCAVGIGLTITTFNFTSVFELLRERVLISK